MLQLSSIYFGQKHPDFDYKDMDVIKQVRRLARKHNRQCENNCNGDGYIKGSYYRLDNDKAYIKEDYNVFDQEIDRIERRILYILNPLVNLKWKITFQHDPRGNTVKLFYDGDYVDLT